MKREKKQKPYNPFTTRTVKRATVGRVKIYLRAVKPNPFDKCGRKRVGEDVYGTKKFDWDTMTFDAEYDPKTIYYYEIGANDGSFRKETDKDKVILAFENLVKFEQRQTEIQ